MLYLYGILRVSDLVLCPRGIIVCQAQSWTSRIQNPFKNQNVCFVWMDACRIPGSHGRVSVGLHLGGGSLSGVPPHAHDYTERQKWSFSHLCVS